MIRTLAALLLVLAGPAVGAQPRGAVEWVIAAFDREAATPVFRATNSKVALQRGEPDGERYLRWDSFDRHEPARLDIGPFAPVHGAFTHVRFRVRSRPFTFWRDCMLLVRDRAGRTCRTNLESVSHDWETREIPLAFMEREASFDAASISHLAFTFRAKSPLKVAFELDDLTLVRQGPTGFPSRRPRFEPSASDATSAFWSPTATLRGSGKTAGLVIEWTPRFVFLGAASALRFRCFPRDLRPYRTIRLRIKATRDVAPAAFSLVLWTESTRRFLAIPLPALSTRWSAVELALDEFGGSRKVVPDHIDEIRIVAHAINDDRGSSSTRARRPVKLHVGRIELVRGAHKDQRWMESLEQRVTAMARGDSKGVASLAAVIEDHRGPSGIWMQHHIASQLADADAAAIPILFSLLDDEAPVVFERAARSLVGFASELEPHIPRLVALIELQMYTARSRGAARVLRAIGKPGIDALVELLDGSTRGIRRVAAEGLVYARSFPVRVLRKLGSRIRHFSGPEAEQAADTLAALGARGVGLLEKIVAREKDREPRLVALTALIDARMLATDSPLIERFQGMDAVAAAMLFLERRGPYQPLRDRLIGFALRDADWRVREAMLEVVEGGLTTRPRLIDFVVPVAFDPQPNVRAMAIKMLQERPHVIARLVPSDIQGLASEAPRIRRIFAELLGIAKSRRAVPALCVLLADGDLGVASAAHRSIRRLRADAERRLPEVRAFLARLPSKQRASVLVEGLEIELDHDDPHTVRRLIEVLGSAAVPRLRLLLRRGKRRVRYEALKQLGELRATEAATDVRALIGHRDVSLRVLVVRTLLLFEDSAAPKALAQLLKDRVRLVRRQANELAVEFRVSVSAPDKR